MSTKLHLLFWSGIILLFVPFFGVRSPLRMIITIAIGLLILWLSVRIGREYSRLRSTIQTHSK